MKTFDELTLEELQRVQKTYEEVIKQIGGLVFQDYNAALVIIPNAITAEIKRKKSKEV